MDKLESILQKISSNCQEKNSSQNCHQVLENNSNQNDVDNCPICHGHIWDITENGSVKRFPCWNKHQHEKNIKFACIPPKYQNDTLESIDLEMYNEQKSKELMSNIIQLLKIWMKAFEDGKRKSLYFWSDTKGSGKTKCISILANMILETNQLKFATSTSIINEIRSSWDKNCEYTESKLINDLCNTPILIIDDFGAEKIKEGSWINDRFYQIINQRYINEKLTLYTSNVPVRELPYDSRIVNRIMEDTTEIHFPEESVRESIAIANAFKVRKWTQ